MPGVLLPREGEPTAVPPRLAHPGASRHPVAAYEAVPMSRLPPPPLGNERDLRRACAMDRAPLPPGATGLPAGLSMPRTRPSLRPLRAHRVALDGCQEPWGPPQKARESHG